MDSIQPGQVISPQSSENQHSSTNDSSVADRPAEQLKTDVASVSPAPTLPDSSQQPLATQAEDGVTQSIQPYASRVSDDTSEQLGSFEAPQGLGQKTDGTVTWTASEFIHHEKGIGWYGALGLVSLIVSALVYLGTKDVVSAGVMLLAAVIFGVYAGYKPRVRKYSLSYDSLQIDARTFSLQDFRYFSISHDGAITSIMLVPLKRFMLPLTLYVGVDVEQRVLEVLDNTLPLEKARTDTIDALMRRIRF